MRTIFLAAGIRLPLLRQQEKCRPRLRLQALDPRPPIAYSGKYGPRVGIEGRRGAAGGGGADAEKARAERRGTVTPRPAPHPRTLARPRRAGFASRVRS